MDAADAGDEAGGRRLVVVHAAGGERRDLEERAAGVEQRLDAVARQQLAAREMLRARFLAAAAAAACCQAPAQARRRATACARRCRGIRAPPASMRRGDVGVMALRRPEQFAADQHAADLVGAGADLVELGVAQDAARRVLVDVAVAAEHLDRLEARPAWPARRRAAGRPPRRSASCAGVAGTGHRIGIGARRHCRRCRGPRAWPASAGSCRSARPNCSRSCRYGTIRSSAARIRPSGPPVSTSAFVVETGHQDRGAPADFAEQVFVRHEAVLEHQFAGVGAAHAELVELLRAAKALHAALDDECRDAGGAAARVRRSRRRRPCRLRGRW